MKALLSIILCFATAVQANPFLPLLSGSPPTGDECTTTANLTFSWHMESTTVTSGTPAGCSDSDTTATLNNSAAISSTQVQDGGNSLACLNNTDYAAFDPSGLINRTNGTLIIYVYFTSWATGTYFFHTQQDGTHYMVMETNGADGAGTRQLRLERGSGAETRTITTTAAAGSGLSLNTWYKVTAKWKATGDPNLFLSVDDANSVTTNNDLTDWTGAETVLRFGRQNSTANYYLDNVKMYDAYL